MSKLTRSLIIATAAASLLVAGCATQGDGTNGTAGQAFTTGNSCKTVQASCKGMSSCKGRSVRHHHHRRMGTRSVSTDGRTTTTTDTTTTQTTDQ